jgi:hypothetical protein
MAPIGFGSYCTLKLLFSRVRSCLKSSSTLLLPQPPISMNHKILTNQIMLSLTEGDLSPCPSLPLSWLSLCSLLLPPGNKESLGQITPLPVVTFGAHISNRMEV